MPNSSKAPSSDGYKEDEKELLTKIRILNQAIDRFDNEDIKKKIKDIAKAVEKVLKNNENDRTEKQKEINELKKRVFTLEQEIDMLHRAKVDAIDPGEAIKIIEMHVASLVLPLGTRIAKIDGFGQIEKFKKVPGNDTTSWDILQKLCGMRWHGDHAASKQQLITNRNVEAHHKKFDLALLMDAMIDQLPHYEQHCRHFVSLFEKVDSLLKFGMLASEPCIRAAVEKRNSNSKAHIRLLDDIKRECYRDVHYLQDIKIDQAKSQLVEYFREKRIPTVHLNSIIDVIKETNRPRLGQLVKRNEEEIASSLLQNLTKLTFDEVDAELNKVMTRNENLRKKAKQWKMLTGGKEWSKYHSTATRELKKMSANNKFRPGEVYPMPVQIAYLHLPDFLDKHLWKAGSDILEIFERWEKKS